LRNLFFLSLAALLTASRGRFWILTKRIYDGSRGSRGAYLWKYFIPWSLLCYWWTPQSMWLLMLGPTWPRYKHSVIATFV